MTENLKKKKILDVVGIIYKLLLKAEIIFKRRALVNGTNIKIKPLESIQYVILPVCPRELYEF